MYVLCYYEKRILFCNLYESGVVEEQGSFFFQYKKELQFSLSLHEDSENLRERQ